MKQGCRLTNNKINDVNFSTYASIKIYSSWESFILLMKRDMAKEVWYVELQGKLKW